MQNLGPDPVFCVAGLIKGRNRFTMFTMINVCRYGFPVERIALKRLLALALAVSVAACAAGCGSANEERARAYLNDAYAKSQKFAQKQVEVEEKGKELMEAIEVPEITPELVQNVERLFDELIVLVEESGLAAEETRDEYEKVLQLDDVEEFKEYARNKIEVLDLTGQETALARQFYDIYKRVFEEVREGKVPDEQAVTDELSPVIEQRDRIRGQIEELNRRAGELREELSID